MMLSSDERAGDDETLARRAVSLIWTEQETCRAGTTLEEQSTCVGTGRTSQASRLMVLAEEWRRQAALRAQQALSGVTLARHDRAQAGTPFGGR